MLPKEWNQGKHKAIRLRDNLLKGQERPGRTDRGLAGITGWLY